MIALGLCLLAFGATWWAGKRSLGLGLVVLLGWGYFFGIIRANLLTPMIYFVFDAALVGFYCSQKRLLTGGDRQISSLRIWCWILMGWPLVLLMMPAQPFLVSLVGLRGAILFIPMIVAGGRLRQDDLRQLTHGIAALNLIAVAFGLAEYFMGLERFFPHNATTLLIYGSVDVEGGFNRIPAIFGTAHLYGGAMSASLPYLIGGWTYAQTRKDRWFILGGAAAALLGVLLSATRVNFVISAVLALMMVLSGRLAPKKRLAIVLLLLVMAGVAMRNTRFQRFKSLSDTDFVEDRISGSVNRGFWEILIQYPMGNGLGGGGTNIPSFLAGQVRNPIGMESEYARILCEQGIIGLLCWIAFLIWFVSHSRRAFGKGPWATGRRLIWVMCLMHLVTAFIGTGTLLAIPETVLFLIGMGFVAMPMKSEASESRLVGVRPIMVPHRPYRPAPSV